MSLAQPGMKFSICFNSPQHIVHMNSMALGNIVYGIDLVNGVLVVAEGESVAGVYPGRALTGQYRRQVSMIQELCTRSHSIRCSGLD